MSDNMRAHPRITEKDSVIIRVLSSPTSLELVNKTFFCTTADLSAGGLKVVMRTPLDIGTPVEVRIALQDPPGGFKHLARVAWLMPASDPEQFAVGLEFSNASKETLRKWAAVIQDKLSRSGSSAFHEIAPPELP